MRGRRSRLRTLGALCLFGLVGVLLGHLLCYACALVSLLANGATEPWREALEIVTTFGFTNPTPLGAWRYLVGLSLFLLACMMLLTVLSGLGLLLAALIALPGRLGQGDRLDA